MPANYTMANINTLTVTELYSNEELLQSLMNTIEILTQISREKIVSNGFESLISIIKHHLKDLDGFKYT